MTCNTLTFLRYEELGCEYTHVCEVKKQGKNSLKQLLETYLCQWLPKSSLEMLRSTLQNCVCAMG